MKTILIHAAVMVLGLGAAFAVPVLPKALILGDSIYNRPSASVAGELKGQVEVVYKHPGSSGEALAGLDDLLGDGKWHFIHFNFGLADLHYKDPRTKSIRSMSREAGGVRVTSPEQYGRNLEELVRHLKGTGAKLVWASTTPIQSSSHLQDGGSEMEYNAIASRIMLRHGIPINDMHGFVTSTIGQKRDSKAFSLDKMPLHVPIVRSILSGLRLTLRGNP